MLWPLAVLGVLCTAFVAMIILIIRQTAVESRRELDAMHERRTGYRRRRANRPAPTWPRRTGVAPIASDSGRLGAVMGPGDDAV